MRLRVTTSPTTTSLTGRDFAMSSWPISRRGFGGSTAIGVAVVRGAVLRRPALAGGAGASHQPDRAPVGFIVRCVPGPGRSGGARSNGGLELSARGHPKGPSRAADRGWDLDPNERPVSYTHLR